MEHKDKILVVIGSGISEIKTAFKCRMALYRIIPDDDKLCLDVKEYMENLKSKVLNCIEQSLNKHSVIKFNLVLYGHYILPQKNQEDY